MAGESGDDFAMEIMAGSIEQRRLVSHCEPDLWDRFARNVESTRRGCVYVLPEHAKAMLADIEALRAERIGHVAIPVSDLARARALIDEALGWVADSRFTTAHGHLTEALAILDSWSAPR